MSLTRKLDKFTNNPLNKNIRVEEPWDELKNVTGPFYEKFISIKPSLPDLVLWSKEKFNKNECFISSENINDAYFFPREDFFIKHGLLKNKI